jgi:hypothetical protein
MDTKINVEQVAMQQLLNNPTVKQKTPADEIGTPGCRIVIGNRFARAGYCLSYNAEAFMYRLIELFQYLVDRSEEGEYSADFSRLSEGRTIETDWGTLKASPVPTGDGDPCTDYVSAEVPVDFLTRDIKDGRSYVNFLAEYLGELSRCRVTLKDGAVLDGFIKPEYSFGPEGYRRSLGRRNRVALSASVAMLRTVFDFSDGCCRFAVRDVLAFGRQIGRRLYPIACSMKAGETLRLSRDDVNFLCDCHPTEEDKDTGFMPNLIFFTNHRCPGVDPAVPDVRQEDDALVLTAPSEKVYPIALSLDSGREIVVSDSFAQASYSVSPFAEDCKVYLLGLLQCLNDASRSEGGWKSGALRKCSFDVWTQWGTARATAEEEDGRAGVCLYVPLQYFVRGRGDCRDWYYRVMSALCELSVCAMKVGWNRPCRLFPTPRMEAPGFGCDHRGTGVYARLFVSEYIFNVIFNLGWERRFREDDVVRVKTYAAKRLCQVLFNGYAVEAGKLVEMVGERTEDFAGNEFEACVLDPAIHSINVVTGRAWAYRKLEEGAEGGASYVFESRKDYKRSLRLL